jgi:hypothetical protein
MPRKKTNAADVFASSTEWKAVANNSENADKRSLDEAAADGIEYLTYAYKRTDLIIVHDALLWVKRKPLNKEMAAYFAELFEELCAVYKLSYNYEIEPPGRALSMCLEMRLATLNIIKVHGDGHEKSVDMLLRFAVISPKYKELLQAIEEAADYQNQAESK